MRTRKVARHPADSFYPVPRWPDSPEARRKYSSDDLKDMDVPQLRHERSTCIQAIETQPGNTPMWYVERLRLIELALKDRATEVA